MFNDQAILGGHWKVPGNPSIFCAFDIMELSLYATSNAHNALIIGLGVGTFMHRFINNNIVCDVIEIDPLVVKYAASYFGVTSNGRVYVEDALHFLDRIENNEVTTRTYDIIVHDVFAEFCW